MPVNRADRALDPIARRQHGCFSRRQAERVGFTPRMFTRRLSSGAWVRLTAGVYAIASHPGTFLRQCWAAHLSEVSSAIGGLTAGALHGLEGIRPGPIELVVPPGSNNKNDLARLHRYVDPAIAKLQGLPVTTIPQTLLDIAPRLSHDAMSRIIDTAVLERRVTIEAIAGRVERYEGSRRPGLPLMRALVAERQADGWTPTESELERLLARVIRPLGLELQWQHSLSWRDALPGRRDAVHIPSRTVIEADGRRWHARFHDFDRDRWRDNVVVAHGYRPVRLTWVHLTERPAEVRALLSAVTRLAA